MDFFVKKSVNPELKYDVEVAVISDIHLGTMACNATALLEYLKSIAPKMLVLNGDIIDAWRFSRNYFPKSQLKIVRHLIKMMEKGTRIYYIAGNHDEILRKFVHTRSGRFKIANQLMLKLGGEKVWFIHGDVFDSVISRLRWLSKLGAAVYGFISLINLALNFLFNSEGKKLNIYKNRTSGFNSENISRFETRVASEAIKRGVQTVICGHTHIPADKNIWQGNGSVRYLNCGDWVENNTSLEYRDGSWNLVWFRQANPVMNEKSTNPSFDTLKNTLVPSLN
jgi:UDP-2,3-diacylglucosamine pyrophosphatase LpxH